MRNSSGNMDTLFKQPKAKPYSKSPRKRQPSSPLSTPDSSDVTRLNKKLSLSSFNSPSLLSSNHAKRSPRKRDRNSRLLENSSNESVSSQKLLPKRQLSSSEANQTENKNRSSMTSEKQSYSRLRSPRKRLASSKDFESDGDDQNSLSHKRLHSSHVQEPLVRRSPRKVSVQPIEESGKKSIKYTYKCKLFTYF